MTAEFNFLRDAYARAKTPNAAVAVTERLLKAMDEKDEKGKYKHDIDDWDIGGIQEALNSADYTRRVTYGALTEAHGPSEFPQAVSGFIARKMLRSYDDFGQEHELVGSQLLAPDKSKKKGDKILRLDARPLLRPTPWGIEAPSFEIGESYVTCTWCRFTRAIDVTQDLIMHDQTESIWPFVSSMGSMAAETLERTRIDSITDQYSTHMAKYPDKASSAYYVYQPEGINTALYSTTSPAVATGTAGNTVESNALADWTNVDTAQRRRAAFVDGSGERVKDSNTFLGKRMRITRNEKLLIPYTLRGTAWQIFKSAMTPQDANTAANPAGPRGFLHFPYIVSQDLDDQSASTWYSGDFKAQFRERMPNGVQVMTANRASQAAFMSRGIYARVVIEYYGAWYATSNRFVVKCTA